MSEPWRNLPRAKSPPRLVLPDVDMELRALPDNVGGGVISSETRGKVDMVDALSRVVVRKLVVAIEGGDLVDGAECEEAFRKSGKAGAANETADLERDESCFPGSRP